MLIRLKEREPSNYEALANGIASLGSSAVDAYGLHLSKENAENNRQAGMLKPDQAQFLGLTKGGPTFPTDKGPVTIGQAPNVPKNIPLTEAMKMAQAQKAQAGKEELGMVNVTPEMIAANKKLSAAGVVPGQYPKSFAEKFITPDKPGTSAVPKASPGFRYKADGTEEPIPGGPADIKLKDAAKKEQLATTNAVDSADRLIKKIDELIPRVSGKTVGAGSLISGIPGTDAKNFSADIKTLQANLAFQTLQSIREASKTGGALGAVSEKELALLESAVSSLDTAQDDKQFKKNLMEVRDSFERIKRMASKAGTSQSSGPKGVDEHAASIFGK